MTSTTNNSADTTDTILQIERRIMTAIRNKDVLSLAPMLAEEFVYRTHFGAEASKSDFLDSIASFPIEVVSLQGEELKVNVFGETAILTGIQRAEARVPEGEIEESAVAFTDVFLRREGQWLMVLAYGVELPAEAETA
jgi:ketosteroid isomerase-like protein